MDQLPDKVDTNARVGVRLASAGVTYLRRRLNLISSGSISISATDDPVDEELDLTFTVSGAPPTGAAGGALDGTYPNPGLAASVAGAGLTETSDVLAVGAGTGITVNANDVQLAASAAGNGLTHTAGVLSLATTSAGAGLTYTTGVLAVGAGNGITVNADDVALASTAGGAGLTYTTGVLAVGAGTGITVAADSIAIDSALIDLDAWTAWTPTFGGTGASSSTATVTGAYTRVGRLIVARLVVVYGASTNFSSDGLTLTLPVAAADPGDIRQCIGSVYLINIGTNEYMANAVIDHQAHTGNDRFQIRGTDQLLTNTVPFAWGASDYFSLTISYQAAS